MILNKDKKVLNSDIFGGKKIDDIIGHTDDVHCNGDETVLRKDWLKNNIPFIETPDNLLDRIYYFRWNNLLSCLGKRKSDGKYEFNESSEIGRYHRYIDCAQGAHVRDARWIRDTKYLSDYIDITPDKEVYWGYLIASVMEKYYIDGDIETIRRNYEKLKLRFHSRDEKFDPEIGLYYLENGIEGQEAGVNGYDLIERLMTFTASHTAEAGSLEALTDNLTEGAYWSNCGSENSSDYIEIKMGVSNSVFTGVRFWFKHGKQVPKVSVFDSENGWITVEKVETKCEVGNMTEISFDKIAGESIRIEFEGTVSIYELAVVYQLEPKACESWWKLISGDKSYRVWSNSAMSAGAMAISKMAAMLGNTEESEKYKKIADDIARSMLDKLWDDGDKFFFELTQAEKHRIVGKESNCYAPWAFSIMPDTEKYSEMWKYLMDESVFLEKFGITSLEKGNPHYMQTFNHGCLWNGPVWPYTFSLILTAMAEHLRSKTVSKVNKDDYYELITRYCMCHFDNESDTILAIREDHHPTENHWIALSPDYNHSTFIDNVLCGLIGIRPAADGLEIDPIVPEDWEYFCVEDVRWRGKDLTVIYDKTGERYGHGAGFMVVLDGEIIFKSDSIEKFEIKN